ncbi:hypothetical protein [Klebsiella quasipneumoniae]|uniref:hypothetical protein n=1 Tax=Klebsiella quasipneumoniae TaxID=1463165 RepID=UPI0029498199|nr:hypothetical protein [Klebsiella quasipneumoniae]EIX9043890.1 hypothetical protein [Klebsiella variicola]MDV5693359.1 hypothetical protein [Klebsiella quasipneumoniae]
MNQDEEQQLFFNKLRTGKIVQVDTSAILIINDYVVIYFTQDDGTVFSAPIPPTLALSLGEQLMRAADSLITPR